jgi:uncharacterized protein (TIGR03067 family)
MGEKTKVADPDDPIALQWSKLRTPVEERGMDWETEDDRIFLTVKGQKYVFRQKSAMTAEGNFSLDIAKTPMVMKRKGHSFYRHCCGAGCLFTSRKTASKCIYSVNEARLVFCLSDNKKKVPRDFVTEGREDRYLLVFERAKP